MRHFAWFSLSLLVIGCHKDATCPAGMVVDEALGYCVSPDAGTDGGTRDAGSMDGGGCVFFRDSDGDTFGDGTMSMSTCSPPTGWVRSAGDCDDANPAIHPGAPEACNGADDDCNLTLDDGFLCARGAMTACTTTCGSSGSALCGATCEPMPTCTPPTETCNYVDDDCDGLTDEGLLDPGLGIELAGPNGPVAVSAVPDGFVIAAVQRSSMPRRFDLVRVNEDGVVTHSVTGVAEISGRIALSSRSGELAAVWTAGDGTLVGQRFAGIDLIPLASARPVAGAAVGIVNDLEASSTGYALTTSDTMGGVLWRLEADLMRSVPPAALGTFATVAITPEPASRWIVTYPGIAAGGSHSEIMVRSADPTTVSLGPALSITTTTSGASVPVVSRSPDGGLAVLYAASRGAGIAEPEIAILDPGTLTVRSRVSIPRPSSIDSLGPTGALTSSGGRWWVARIIQEFTTGFLARLRVVEIDPDGTVLGAGTMGTSPECDPPDSDCAPANPREAVVVAASNGRVLVATSNASGPSRAWLYRCR